MQKKLTTTFFLLIAMNNFAQKATVIVSGKIYDSQSTISNVNIVNLRTKLGTVTNDIGQFEIVVKLNDTILFSSIQHHKKYITITKKILQLKTLNVMLKHIVNELDEVFVHSLSGNLNTDIKTIKDTIPKNNFKYNPKTIFSQRTKLKKDFSKPPNAQAMIDPTYVGGTGAAIPNFQLISYCEYLNIIEKYYNNKTLEVI